MPKTVTLKANKTARPARKANTRARASRQMREMQARTPATDPHRPTRDYAGLQKIARLMSGVSQRAASAYADARTAEGDRFVRLAQAGYREAMTVFEHILKDKKVLSEKEQEDLITLMNQVKLLNIRVQDYASASKDEAWRRDNGQEWNPHPFGEDQSPLFARETY